MPSRPPNARPSPPRKAWAQPSSAAHKRIRGRRGVAIRADILSEEPLCRICFAQGIVTEATEVDHILPLSRGGSDARSNKQPLCYDHHREKTDAERYTPEAAARRLPADLKPSLIPLTIVCGPPGSGKSTYVRERADIGDLIIDLDVIMADLSGLPVHADKPGWVERGLEERNRRLRLLGDGARHDRAWFIIACPNAEERQWWADQLRPEAVKVLAVPIEDLERRIRSDITRRGREAPMIKWAQAWWRTYTATSMDEG